jgi:two-component system CheB/CheR fusion protein
VSASKSFYKKFTFTPEETEGILLYDIGNKEWDIPALRKLLEDVLPKNSEFYDFEVTHVFPRLGEKIMLLNATRLHQKIHRDELILLSIEDNTERKKSRQAILESEERFETALAAVKGVVWTNNSKGEMEGEQKGWASLTGQSYAAYQGYGWTKAIHPDDIKPTIKAWQKALKESTHFIFEHRVRVKTGEWRNFSIKAIPIVRADGSIKQWVGVHIDITMQKMAEEKITNFAKELEKEVQDRTKKLAISNQQLEEKNLTLQILNKELHSFSYVASHDLQEPLRKIRTLASRIIESENALSEKGKDYFERMQKAAERMQALIEDLLSYSNVQNLSGRKLNTTDLNVIVDDVKSQLSEIIKEKKATIITGALCNIDIIPYQFRQVMLNLISNALKFTKPGVAPVITIESNTVKYDKINKVTLPRLKEYRHITVADNGIGFEEEYNEKIFEIFQRLHDKDDYPGTGIGLAIVKKIVENHNGIITARGELGQGATFEMYIPA